jgi:hypothetical protein
MKLKIEIVFLADMLSLALSPFPVQGSSGGMSEDVDPIASEHRQATSSDNVTERMYRLENFLDGVLKKNLGLVLRKRDALFDAAAQCVQLRDLLTSLPGFVSDGCDDPDHPPGVQTYEEAVSAIRPTCILAHLGCHYYMEAEVRNSGVVHVNIGCGVVVPMSSAEAKRFLVAKEGHLRAAASRQTVEAAKVKYRIRLVMEAIAALDRSVRRVPPSAQH